MKKGKKDKLTILIDKEVKENYQKFCKERGLIMGKQIELFMGSEIKKMEKEARSDGNRK